MEALTHFKYSVLKLTWLKELFDKTTEILNIDRAHEQAKNVKKRITIPIIKPVDDTTWQIKGSLEYNNICLNELFPKNIDYHSG